ncbi:MAG: ATPase [Clostridia bacterium]|nr:ATPase [Clostridia bacterium]
MKNTYLGIELGSTRIKAVQIDESFKQVAAGDFTWKSSFENGIWTYPLEAVWTGLKQALSALQDRTSVQQAGISAMMHGYLAFDENWNLLTPFRTWQNTITGEAADRLSALFNFNVPQRWSISHLYQAMLNGEEHLSRIAHITTLSGYVHYMLTGMNVLGVGDASGMFPIDEKTMDYDQAMLDKMDALTADYPWNVRDLLPKVLTAGDAAGCLTEQGAALLDGLLPSGIPFAPPEGDAGTGMVATNAVAPRTGNVSAGTSIFAMVVLEKQLSRVYPEIDVVTTPAGKPVAMVHCNNCTADMNAWVKVFAETAALFGAEISTDELYAKLYQKSLEGDADCGNVLVYNYLAGEGITHLDEGRPMVLRRPDSNFTLANFLRSQLYSTLATLKLGMDILESEQVGVDSLTGHGGLFKQKGVGQRYLAAACNTAVTCMENADVGGPYGMALLAAYTALRAEGEVLEDFLAKRVFCNAKSTTLSPTEVDVAGFTNYLKQYCAALSAQKAAVEAW